MPRVYYILCSTVLAPSRKRQHADGRFENWCVLSLFLCNIWHIWYLCKEDVGIFRTTCKVLTVNLYYDTITCMCKHRCFQCHEYNIFLKKVDYIVQIVLTLHTYLHSISKGKCVFCESDKENWNKVKDYRVVVI